MTPWHERLEFEVRKGNVFSSQFGLFFEVTKLTVELPLGWVPTKAANTRYREHGHEQAALLLPEYTKRVFNSPENILIKIHRTKKLSKTESRVAVAVSVLPWVRPRGFT